MSSNKLGLDLNCDLGCVYSRSSVTIFPMRPEFKAAIELPETWKKPVSDRIKSVFGQKGLNRFVVCAWFVRLMRSNDDAELLQEAIKLDAMAKAEPERFAALMETEWRAAQAAIVAQQAAEYGGKKRRGHSRPRKAGAG